MTRNITLITMSQGNPIALKRTLDSFKDVCNEVVFGDLLVFDDDREIIKGYEQEYNLKSVKLPFDFIFKNGFSAVLNELASHATNELVLYMNVGEVVDGEERILKLVNEMFFNHNCFAFDHATDKHSWFRLYDRKDIQWGGIIHEELFGERNDCSYYVFRMKDSEKDMVDPFKAAVMNTVNDFVYFQQYIKLVENPELQSKTNDYWVGFATQEYNSMKERLRLKGRQYEAFVKGDFEMFINEVATGGSLKKERFESSTLINFQGARKDIL